jgi:uncharacterized protein YecE (DUF72 family)
MHDAAADGDLHPRRGRGSLYVGTSGFAYPDWAPLFYPAGTRGSGLLPVYAARLNAVELNNTFYQQPKPERVAAWLAATPPEFRFVVKAQRGGSMRAFGSAAAQTVEWLTRPYRWFGERLGAVLFRVPGNVRRSDHHLRALLATWPADLPIVTEFQHDSWHIDEIHRLLADHGAVLCATDLDDRDPPDLRLTGRSIYLRLRRTTYSDNELADWSDRLAAFLDAGTECFVFLRHDEGGKSALRAMKLLELSAR